VSVRVLVTGLVVLALAGVSWSEPSAGSASGPPTAGGEAAGGLPPELKAEVTQAIDRALSFLEKGQKQDGSWEEYPAITALALKCFFDSPARPRAADHPSLARALAYLEGKAHPDGSICDQDLPVYNTALAVLALRAARNPDYEPLIQQARDYLVSVQADEGKGVESADPAYGGFGYGGGSRPDLSNLSMAVDALRDAGLPQDSPVWKRVVTFVSRCQNNTSTNDAAGVGALSQVAATDDGGLFYSPTESKAGQVQLPNGKLGYKSYGSMTYEGLKSFIYAHLSKDDPRVEAALRWIRSHYTLEENPEVGSEGLYYYYHTFAKALSAYGEDVVVDASGKSHAWRVDLAKKLLGLQRADGSWQNHTPRWWESNPVLVTTYAVLALESCLE
jgi:squalene-hopene/tetraprenyl-beta-curcumene cyclase